MQAIAAVTLPFFALVLCGWLAARQRYLPESAIPGLNAFVLYFALPCLLLRFGMNTPIAQQLDPTILVLWLVVALAIIAFTIGVTLGPGVGLKDASFGALVAAFPNSGFIGVPLLVAVMGEASAGPVICAMLVDMLVTTTLCVGLSQVHAPAAPDGGAASNAPAVSADTNVATSAPAVVAQPTTSTLPAVSPAHEARAAAMRALKGALSNPMPWAVLAGAALSYFDLKLTGPAYAVISMLADAASPVALFTIGAVLWRAGQHAHTRTPLGRVVPVVAIKLVLHPLAVFLAGAGARQLGAPISGYTLAVLTLLAALPSASNVAILTERFGADTGRVARIIMGSTMLAVMTFTALAWWFDARPAR